MSKQFSIGDHVRVTRSGHAQDKQLGIVQKVEPAGDSQLVEVCVRGLPFEHRKAWHALSFLSAVKK